MSYFILSVPKIYIISDVVAFENDGAAVVQIKRSGSLKSEVLVNVATMDGTAIG